MLRKGVPYASAMLLPSMERICLLRWKQEIKFSSHRKLAGNPGKKTGWLPPKVMRKITRLTGKKGGNQISLLKAAQGGKYLKKNWARSLGKLIGRISRKFFFLFWYQKMRKLSLQKKMTTLPLFYQRRKSRIGFTLWQNRTWWSTINSWPTHGYKRYM